MKAKCKVCEKEFEKYGKPNKRGKHIPRRHGSSITCSTKCSQKWTKLRQIEYQREYRKKYYENHKDYFKKYYIKKKKNKAIKP